MRSPTMAKNDPLSFDFGYNVAPKRPKASAAKKGGKKPRSAAQRYAAAMYAGKSRRR
jgi:hypothetical protein